MYYCTDVRGAAALIDVAPTTIYNWIRIGKIQFIKYGRRYLIPLKEIAAELRVTQDYLIGISEKRRIPLWLCR